MSAFLLLPTNESDSAYQKRLLHAFEQRGFETAEIYPCGPYHLYAFPSLDGSIAPVWRNAAGDTLLISGTCFYKGKAAIIGAAQLFDDLTSGKVNAGDLQGTFCLIAFAQSTGRILLVHDSGRIYRIYRDLISGAISSSFSVLTKSGDDRSPDKDILAFNIVFGFLPAEKTWDKNIIRILKKESLPADIDYRISEYKERNYRFTNIGEAVEAAASLLIHKMQIAVNHDRKNSLMGLSSGFDSRLVASLLSCTKIKDLLFFTFHKPGAADPVIAEKIAETLERELLRKETYRPKDRQAQEEVFSKAFKFFDGQSVTMMQYSKPDYTAEFRKELFGKEIMHFSGVGGELFRNYNFDHGRKSSIKDWMEAYLLASLPLERFSSAKGAAKLFARLKNYLHQESGFGDQLSYTDRKRFYGDLFLRDWHSVRNSVENQYSLYFTPFTDREVIGLSYQCRPFMGAGGKFEAELIRKISPSLAAINSGYGFPFDSYPARAEFTDRFRAMAKLPVLSRLRKTGAAVKPYQPTEFEAEQLAVFDHLGLDLNIKTVQSGSKRIEPLLSAAYALKQLYIL